MYEPIYGPLWGRVSKLVKIRVLDRVRMVHGDRRYEQVSEQVLEQVYEQVSEQAKVNEKSQRTGL